MANDFIYSRRFSNQAENRLTIQKHDTISLSIPVELNGNDAYQTRQVPISDLVADLDKKIIDDQFYKDISIGSGLIGNGSVDKPLEFDSSLTDGKFIDNAAWPFSQVGDPRAVQLPLNGVYFSVAQLYARSNNASHIPMVLEPNGDLRMLRKVTNGTSVVYTYCVWENYRNTPATSIVHTDTRYVLPGLTSSEFVSHLYTASETAMVAELSTTNTSTGITSFKEHIVILTNGVLDPKYHTFIRLGNQVTNLFYNSIASGYVMRASNISAAVVGGRLFLSYGVVSTDVPYYTTAGGLRFISGEVNLANNTLTLLENISVTNEFGKNAVSSGKVTAWISACYSTDPNSVDALFVPKLASESASLNAAFKSGNYSATSTASSTTFTWCHVVGNEIVVALSALYTLGSDGVDHRTGVYQTFFYFNPLTKSVRPFESRKRKPYQLNRTLREAPDAAILNSDIFEQIVPRHAGESFGLYMFNDGFRLIYNYSSQKKYRQQLGVPFTTADSNVVDAVTGANDSNWTDGQTIMYPLYGDSPTAIMPYKLCYILHDRLVGTDGEYDTPWTIDNESGDSFYGDLIGASNAETYTVLTEADDFSAVQTTGYAQNISRGYMPKGHVTPSLTSVVDNRNGGKLYYHNASWCLQDMRDTGNYYNIDRELQSGNKYTIANSVYSAVITACRGVSLLSGYSGYDSELQYITPVAPGIGFDYAIIDYYRIERIAGNPDNKTNGRLVLRTALARINQTVASDGTCNITNLYLLNTDFNVPVVWGTPGVRGLSVGPHFKHYCSHAVSIAADGSCDVVTRAGGVSDLGAVSHYNYTDSLCARYDTSLVIRSATLLSGIYSPPTIGVVSKTIGFIESVGCGAVYAFRQLNFSNWALQSTYTILPSTSTPRGFILSQSAPITVYVSGRRFTIPRQVIDLRDHISNYANATIHGYVEIIDGVVRYRWSTTLLKEHLTRINIGKVVTDALGITTTAFYPVSRWDIARTSLTAGGETIAVSTNSADSATTTLWRDASFSEAEASQYMWDIKDTVDWASYDFIEMYWAMDPAGLFRIGSSELGDRFYLIARAVGKVDSVTAMVGVKDVDSSDFIVGLNDGSTAFDMVFAYDPETNISIGYHEFKINAVINPDYRWTDATSSVRLNTDYVNDGRFTAWLNVSLVTEISNNAELNLYQRNPGAYILIDDYDIVYFRSQTGTNNNGQWNQIVTASVPVPAGSKYRIVSNPTTAIKRVSKYASR